MSRQIVLDTETTGIDPLAGHRLIEIGCVELVDRKFTGRTYHQYIQPERVVEDEAIQIHGITNEFLVGKPIFSQVSQEFCDFIAGAELIIHNAPFDLGFLNHELGMIASSFGKVESHCPIIDTLVMARHRFPGQRNSLDALCRRFGVDNSHRELHGALLDSEILADVYLLMSGGQKGLALDGDDEGQDSASGIEEIRLIDSTLNLPRVTASAQELASHADYVGFLEKKSGKTNLFEI